MTRWVLVTGATDGIGKETALELGRRGFGVIVHGRNAVRADAVVEQIKTSGGAARGLRADFADLAEVHALADQVLASFPTLHALVNNAGIFPTERKESAEGFEHTVLINHLAPFVLTHRLLPALSGGRIVNVSSMAHGRAPMEREDPMLRRGWNGYRAYAWSKLCNVLFTRELARRLGPAGPVVVSLHPGVVSTKLLKTGFSMDGPDSFADGAATSVHLVVMEPPPPSGGYWVRSSLAPESPIARDPENGRWLYVQSCHWTGLPGLPA